MKYLDYEPITLKPNYSGCVYEVPEYATGGRVTFVSSIYQLYLTNASNKELVSIDQINSNFASNLLNYVNTMVLHHLKYIDIGTRTILVPAAALAQAEVGESEEDLIVIFELIKSNLMIDEVVVNNFAIFKNFESFFNDNVLDELLYNESIASIFSREHKIGHFADNKDIFNQLNRNVALSSDCYDLSDFLDSTSRSESWASQPPELLRLGLTKSLTVYYRTLKEFQNEYQMFYGLDVALTAELIMNKTFDNFEPKSLLVAHRLMSFVQTDFVIPDLYAIDALQYQIAVANVQKSLKALAFPYKIAFYHYSQANFSWTEKIELEKQLPFSKNYSTDAGKLAKIMLTNFLIYNSLVEANDLFAPHFKAKLSLDWITKKYNVTFDLLDFYRRGKKLIDKLYVFIDCVQNLSEETFDSDIFGRLPMILGLLNRMIAFYEIEQTNTNSKFNVDKINNE